MVRLTIWLALMMVVTLTLHQTTCGDTWRTWTVTGLAQPLEAVIVKRNENDVTLRRRDGLLVSVALEALAAKDREFVSAWREPPGEVHDGDSAAVLANDYRRLLEETSTLNELADLELLKLDSPDKRLAEQTEKIALRLKELRLAPETEGPMVRSPKRAFLKRDVITLVAAIGPLERRLDAMILHLTNTRREQEHELAQQKAESAKVAAMMRQAQLWEPYLRYARARSIWQDAVNHVRDLATGRVVVWAHESYRMTSDSDVLTSGYYNRQLTPQELAAYADLSLRSSAEYALSTAAATPTNLSPSREAMRQTSQEARKLVETNKELIELKALREMLQGELRALGPHHQRIASWYFDKNDELGKIGALTTCGWWDGPASTALVDRGLADPSEAVQRAAMVALIQCELGILSNASGGFGD